MKHINAWTTYNKKDVDSVMDMGHDYKEFISKYKSCREFAHGSVALAKNAGYKPLQDYIKENKHLKCGDKVYATCQDRLTIFAVIGQDVSAYSGMNILGAHTDSPRIDIKQNPIFQRDGVVMFETHYYGGISLYQWVNLPMSLHGVVVKKDGTKIDINIGEDKDDPVFFINDLLVHLSYKNVELPANKFIDPEKMDLLVGSRPLVDGLDIDKDQDNSKVYDPQKAAKKNSVVSQDSNEACTQFILKLLYDKYGICEDDLESSELEALPLGPARDCGFDRSMVMGYGHDDSASAYPSIRAIFDVDNPKRTCVCVLTDKEEIGSVGATGMESKFFENTIAEIMHLCGCDDSLSLRRYMASSYMISSDVSAAVDPSYRDKFEALNSCYFGDGVVFNKYGGSAGKRASNDASPEFCAFIRRICEENNVVYQTSELGAVGVGGGGTIAYIPASYGMEVIDAGVPVLSMHCPWEVVNKADIYESYKFYKAFLECEERF